MKKERKDESFLKQPYYPGGDKALKEFIQTHLKYPETAKLNKIEGSVPLRYDINYKGEVIGVHIVAGLHPECDAEAVRVVRLLKFIVPKTPRNLRVIFHKNIRIHFHYKENPINDEYTQTDNPTNGLQFNYTVVNKKTKEKTAPQKTSLNYQYTIQI